MIYLTVGIMVGGVLGFFLSAMLSVGKIANLEKYNRCLRKDIDHVTYNVIKKYYK